jgi:hypothetical protein
VNYNTRWQTDPQKYARVDVLLQDRTTLELRVSTNTWEREHLDGLDFMWSEGNYACDCNRALFWARALNPDADDATGCSHGRFAAVEIFVDGKPLDDWHEDYDHIDRAEAAARKALN